MERVLKPKDVAAHYGCSVQTAREYIRKMEHMEKPLSVYESALLQWEYTRTTGPSTSRKPQKTKGPVVTKPTGKKFIIPRVREVTP